MERETKKLTLVIILTLIVSVSYSQIIEKKVRLNGGVDQFMTGSGFASGTELYLMINDARKKSFAMGLFFSPETNKPIGIIINHEVFLLRDKQHKLEPLIFYNFIYRKTRISEPCNGLKDGINYGTSYSSIEHYLGAGLKFNLTKAIYCSGKLGFGTYLGSIKKPVIDPVSMDVRGGNGFGLIAKAGIGVTIF